jgi:hypothetical protein
MGVGTGASGGRPAALGAAGFSGRGSEATRLHFARRVDESEDGEDDVFGERSPGRTKAHEACVNRRQIVQIGGPSRAAEALPARWPRFVNQYLQMDLRKADFGCNSRVPRRSPPGIGRRVSSTRGRSTPRETASHPGRPRRRPSRVALMVKGSVASARTVGTILVQFVAMRPHCKRPPVGGPNVCNPLFFNRLQRISSTRQVRMRGPRVRFRS